MANNFWSLGLIKAINDPRNHIISSNIAVVIKDLYPKARHHYLVLPLDSIPNIYSLDTKHLLLLDELYLMAVNIIEVKKQKFDDFQIGFHAEPSMQRLHMHVISKDFISDCLKTKRHWNSFNTKFFVSYKDLKNRLECNGKYEALEKATINSLINQDLQCNQCNFKPKTMPTLKQHLLNHYNQKQLKV